MHTLSQLAKVETISFLYLLLVAVAYQMLTGRIRVQGMLRTKTRGDFDPGRLQALVVSLVICVLLLVSLGEKEKELSLPSASLLYLFGGSQGIYMVRKILQLRGFTQGE